MATLSSCSRLSSGGATAFHHHHGRRRARATVITYRSFSAGVGTAAAASTTATTASVQQNKECSLPTWAEFELGKAPVYWKTMNGLPPSPGEGLALFYNPAATKMTPNNEFGIAFNGKGFNQPIMCGGEPRQMTLQARGKADPPIYTIRILAPQHAMTLIFSFTNGVEWDGPYSLNFRVPKPWLNKPLSFFNDGLADEMNREGACDRAIFPDENIVITSCDIGSFYEEGGDRCKLDIVTGCMDPNSHLFDPLATVDDGTCPLESDSEE